MADDKLVGQRGKKSEKIVEELFKKWNNKASFTHHRFPDARSARGAIKSQPGDMLFFCSGRGGVVEVKETQHLFRIAKDKIPQLPTLHKFELAGALCVILVHHSVAHTWRAVPAKELPNGVSSWDLSGWPEYPDAESALLSTGYFEL